MVIFRSGKNVYFLQSWPIFPEFAMCFYVQKDKFPFKFWNFPRNTNISPQFLITILPFFSPQWIISAHYCAVLHKIL